MVKMGWGLETVPTGVLPMLQSVRLHGYFFLIGKDFGGGHAKKEESWKNLVENFYIAPITTTEADMKTILA